jgi:hypothetical protein
MGRIRFKCPDMHDFDLAPVDCPWATPSQSLGGPNAGTFTHPCIGDWVWISLEKQHPFGPIWTGFATPTRRKFYTNAQVSQPTPTPLNEDGKLGERPKDYDPAYLPKDGRPMIIVRQTRYGNADIDSAIGFNPAEHKDPPPPPDHDALQKAKFQQAKAAPEVNNPDRKYMARVTKYGIISMLSDQGYWWKKDGEYGEFTGDHKLDAEFEAKRWLYLQKLLNEGNPRTNDGKYDSRRWAAITRYGSRIEMRDTGWAQAGPVPSKSREGELGPARILSKETVGDYRWIKIRTKGGMLLQGSDIGFHAADDEFIKRKLLDESGTRSEKEDEYWKGKDARWWRMITRYGIKFVLDDRGSDSKAAHRKEDPRGNGFLLKGRRSAAAKMKRVVGKPRGFHFEANENDAANRMLLSSPMGLAAELNDRYQYLGLAASMGQKFTPKWMGLKENEFGRIPMVLKNFERNSHHLKLDHDNEYLRLKTRGGNGPRAMSPANPSGVAGDELQAGLEARDGREGDGPWTELVDCQHRGMWLSKRHRLGIWRARKGNKMYMWMDDQRKKIVLYNNEADGTLEIFCAGKVNVISRDDVTVSADNNLRLRAGNAIHMTAGSTKLTLDEAGVRTNKNYYGRMLYARVCGLKVGNKKVTGGCPQPGGTRVGRLRPPTLPRALEPTDRGKTYNGPFEECPLEEVEHPLPQ